MTDLIETVETVETSEPQVRVYGIRHHGPGSARSLVSALDAYGPDQVLIEGPADADALLPWAASAQTEPPVALLAYQPDRPARAAFWPFAAFSPEWQAIAWAQRAEVPVAFCDLPASHSLAGGPGAGEGAEDDDGDDRDQDLLVGDPTEDPETSRARHDPLGVLAEAAGYDDPERWWDDLVEARLDSSSPFELIAEAMAEMRSVTTPRGASAALHEQRREAYMRQRIRTALKAGRQRIAVVCGAWHAPVLTMPLPPVGADAKLLRGMPRLKVKLTWVPWTHRRLAVATGYGAGVDSPGWYHHLWSAPDRPVTRWLTTVARALRERDLSVSSAHVIESVRLAETLAALRGRPLAGLAEVDDATRAVLCEGDESAVRFVTDELVVGQALGRVDPGVPTVPLEADLIAVCRRLRVRREAAAKLYDLDLRKEGDHNRSVLFHRLRVLDLDWIVPAVTGIQSRGTFRESWQAEWQPEFAISLVEAAAWGTTVAAAATAKMLDDARSDSLVELTAAVERSLHAELPGALDALLEALTRRAALDADVSHQMDALPPLARAQRYGDVRGTDTTALARVAETLLVRICAALAPAAAHLDADAAREFRVRLDRVHDAVGLLDAGGSTDDPTHDPPHDAPMRRWLDTLATLLERHDVHGEIVGRVVRVLFDAERLDDVPVRVHRALSYGSPAAEKAAWIDGFFADGALLLIHDDELRALLDRWVLELTDDEFVDVLPLVRRTFGTFAAPERRMIAERLDRVRAGSPRPVVVDEFDLDLAGPALATVALILDRGARS